MLAETLNKMPQKQAIAVSIAAAFGIAYVPFQINRLRGTFTFLSFLSLGRSQTQLWDTGNVPKTMSTEWKTAEKSYRKVQNLNPIRHNW